MTPESWNNTVREGPRRRCLVCNDSVIRSSSQSSPVNFCWPSPARSFLVSSPVETHDLIYVRFKTLYVSGNGVSSSTRGGEGFVFLSSRHICFARVYQHSHSVKRRAFVFYGHHTRFVTLLQRTVLVKDTEGDSKLLSGLPFICHGNSDNNLESPYVQNMCQFRLLH
jgi:hypothetical protein